MTCGPSTTFRYRLGRAIRLVQAEIDRAEPPSTVPREPVTFYLELDELMLILVPKEARLLAHLQAGLPYRDLLGQPGFHSISERGLTLGRLYARIHKYCGGDDPLRKVQTLRKGYRCKRSLTLASKLPNLVVFVSPLYWFQNQSWLKRLPGSPRRPPPVQLTRAANSAGAIRRRAIHSGSRRSTARKTAPATS
jgi:hypothetical protein